MKLTARQRSQLPTCYYEGFLEKRSFKDKTSLKLWTCLCGNTLFFFNDKRDPNYIEKVDLGGFVSITDDSSQDRNLDAARLCLQLKDGYIRFTAPNPEARELWKGYIRSVAELAVPVCLTLLPGQIHMLKETVEKEKLRINYIPASSSPNSLQGDKPACFHNIPRLEAELLLEREAKRGNLLLRPGSNGNSFAVTTRQDFEGSVIKHYLVTPKPNRGFVINVDTPVLCATLHDVINYLVRKTDGYLIPLVAEETYDRRISFIYKDFENGEKGIQEATTSPISPNVPFEKVASRTPTPEPTPAQTEEDNFYLNDELAMYEETEDVSAAALPQLDKKAPKKAIMPPVLASSPAPVVVLAPVPVRAPVPVPRSLIPCSTKSRHRGSCTLANPKRQIPLATISELKLKFEQQGRS